MRGGAILDSAGAGVGSSGGATATTGTVFGLILTRVVAARFGGCDSKEIGSMSGGASTLPLCR